MAIFGHRRRDRRTAAVDGFEFPGSVRQRFAARHGDLTADGIRAVEAAGRQWFRLAARHPRARLAMPSVIVDDYWREFTVQTREYAQFCATALGRTLPYAAADSRSPGLRTTFRYAYEDQPDVPGLLPALFRVDQDLAVAGGRSYLADCGGRGLCYELKGSICLAHLDGPGKTPGGGRWSDRRTDATCGAGSSTGDGCGSSCGGGCGGGN